MPKISVIVPVYKVEKYIEKCARSLFEQTLDDIEYIFVNDGSLDSSVDVLRRVLGEYPHRRTQTHIYNKENGGLASVKRYAIPLATGDYIIFCDSDDWVDNNLYENLYKKAIITGVDIVMCPVIEEWEDHTIIRKLNKTGEDCHKILENWYCNCVQMYTVNKLVKRTIYTENNILPFEGINMWEDNGLMLRIFYYADRLAHVDNASYHYFKGNTNALSYSYGRKSVNQMLKCAQLLDEFFKSKPDYMRYKKTADSIKYYARINLITDKLSGLKEYYKTFPETNYIIPYLGRNSFSSKGIIRYRFVRYHFAWLFVLMLKLVSWKRK